jgi:CheY-specific phosphatase CheX
MFFAEVLGESAEPEPATGDIAVQLTFQGEPSGSLLLCLTGGAARQIAADFLALDESEVSAAQTCDVVRELSNMICGSVLSRLESTTPFHLAGPQIVQPSAESGAGPSHTRYCVQLSNGTLTVALDAGMA